MIHQVDEEFIKQAHKAACADWKKKIEEKFPLLFPKFSMSEVQRKFPSVNQYNTEVQGNFLKIPIPNCNNGWTNEAFETAKKITDLYPLAYVDWIETSKHIDFSSTNYLVINFRTYMHQ